MRELPERKVESLNRLYNYWTELYDREDYGLDWNEDTAENDIKQYMVDQVLNLKQHYQKKIGFSEANGNKLLKFLAENPGLPNVFIPVHSFE
jgi:hypothetical protein